MNNGFQIEGLENAMRLLHNVADDVLKEKILNQVLRPHAQSVGVAAFKAEITDSLEPVEVFRNGKLYATIDIGQLRESIGVFIGKSKEYPNVQIGPRVKGKFSNPNVGGWFAHFANYGFAANNRYHSGPNMGFADRAASTIISSVEAPIAKKIEKQIEKRINYYKKKGKL